MCNPPGFHFDCNYDRRTRTWPCQRGNVARPHDHDLRKDLGSIKWGRLNTDADVWVWDLDKFCVFSGIGEMAANFVEVVLDGLITGLS